MPSALSSSSRSRARRFELYLALAVTIVPFLGFIAACVLLARGTVGVVDLVLLVVFYAISMIGIEVGYHRHFSHRAFRGPPAVRWFLGFCGSSAFQGPVIWWAATHRRHHAFSDREGDPHSPVQKLGRDVQLKSFWHSHMGWMFSQPHSSLVEVGQYASDLLRDPTAHAINRWYFRLAFLGLLLPTLIGGLAYGSIEGAARGLLWGGIVRIFLVQHVVWGINSFGHAFGRRRFETRDNSRNVVIIALLSGGAGWHNNHHQFPSSARVGVAWWELDLCWWLIQALARMGLVDHVLTPSRNALERSMGHTSDEAETALQRSAVRTSDKTEEG